MPRSWALAAIVCLSVFAAPVVRAQDSVPQQSPAATPPTAKPSPNLIPTKRVEPQWPRNALVTGTSGMVRVGGTVATDGSVKEVHVIESKPAGVFDAAALRAVKQWTFEPHVVDGVAVEREFEQTINFNLAPQSDIPPPALVNFAKDQPDAAFAMYKRMRTFCPDVYPRKDDVVNAALRMEAKPQKFSDEAYQQALEKNKPEYRGFVAAYQIRAISSCLFSSWEQFRDPDAFAIAAQLVGLGEPKGKAAESAAALSAYAAHLRGTPGVPAPTDEQVLQVRSWLFLRASSAYYELINAQAKQFPPAEATSKTAVDALDQAKDALARNRSRDARLILEKALKSVEEPADRGLLLLALSRVHIARNDFDDAIQDLNDAIAIEQAPWNLLQTAQMARATLCGRMGDAACFDDAQRTLNRELGVADRLSF